MALIITCSEKYLNDHVDDDYMDHCPSEYGYLDDPDECDGGKIRDICVRCWNRLIVPENKTYNPIKEAYKLMVNHCHRNMLVDFNKVIRYLGEALETNETQPLRNAYKLIVDFHHHGKTTDLEEVIGYLGEALDDECIYIDKPWPKVNPYLTESMRRANEEFRKAAEAIENLGKTVGKVVDIREENEGVTVVVEPTIKDSGDRTQFESGAVRDMREGKGRCDLMPLEVVAGYFGRFYCKVGDKVNTAEQIFNNIHAFMDTGDTDFLYLALRNFENTTVIVPTLFLEVAKHFEDGAKKYGENNWQKGIPVHCYIDSAVRHYLKWLRGDTDEPHDRAFVWNLMCCIWEVDHHKEDSK